MAPLDPGFQPAVLANRRYVAAAKASGAVVPLVLGLERENGLISRYETVVRAAADAETLQYVERLVKFLLWAWGGWKLHVGGPPAVGEFIRQTYSMRGARKFDCDMMALAFGRKFQVVATTAGKVPANKSMQVAAGGHLKGCRIGFDLGASDYKVSAVASVRDDSGERFPVGRGLRFPLHRLGTGLGRLERVMRPGDRGGYRNQRGNQTVLGSEGWGYA